jgi:hypothetical protein
MDREPLEFDDEALTRYFAAANEQLEADEFASRVLRRAQRRSLIRDAVLGAAIVIAVLIALEPMLATLQDLATSVVALADGWRDPAWYRENALVVGAVLAMAGWPFLARWLAS